MDGTVEIGRARPDTGRFEDLYPHHRLLYLSCFCTSSVSRRLSPPSYTFSILRLPTPASHPSKPNHRPGPFVSPFSCPIALCKYSCNASSVVTSICNPYFLTGLKSSAG